MKTLKAASTIACMAATAILFAPGARAQATHQTGNSDKMTKITFSAPVEIPGVHQKGYRILPAGTYVFRLVDSQTNRHIVQIQNEDQSKTFATIMAIPDSRIKPTKDTVITFRERPSGQPPALRAWFYPNAAWGDVFVYPKSEARDLAMRNKTPVLYSEDDNSNAKVDAYNQQGEEVGLNDAVTSPALSETSQATEMAQNTPPANSAPAPATRSASKQPAELPETAGNSGLLLLGGLLALSGGFAARGVRRGAL